MTISVRGSIIEDHVRRCLEEFAALRAYRGVDLNLLAEDMIPGKLLQLIMRHPKNQQPAAVSGQVRSGLEGIDITHRLDGEVNHFAASQFFDSRDYIFLRSIDDVVGSIALRPFQTPVERVGRDDRARSHQAQHVREYQSHRALNRPFA